MDHIISLIFRGSLMLLLTLFFEKKKERKKNNRELKNNTRQGFVVKENEFRRFCLSLFLCCRNRLVFGHEDNFYVFNIK